MRDLGPNFTKIKNILRNNNWNKITYDNADNITNKTLQYALQTVGCIHSVTLKAKEPAEFQLHMNEDFKNKYGYYFDNCRVYDDIGDFNFLFWIEELTFLFNWMSLNSNINKTIYINIHDHPIDNGKEIKTINDHPFPNMKNHTVDLKISVTTRPDNNFPIYCWSPRKDYNDIGLPMPDILMFYYGYWFSEKFNINNYQNNNGVKKSLDEKIPKAFFRGSYTNCAYPISTSVRLRAHLKTLQDENENNKDSLIDAYVVGKENAWVYTNYLQTKLKNDDLEDWLKPNKFTDADKQPDYRYLLNLDGFASAWRIIQEIYFNSILIIPESNFTDVIRNELQPWIHYVPVKSDLSNLKNTVKWCNNNLDKMELILTNLKNLRKIFTLENFLELARAKVIYFDKKITLETVTKNAINDYYIMSNIPIIQDDILPLIGKETTFKWVNQDGTVLLNEKINYQKYLKYKNKYLKLRNKLIN